jgi:hypothetical protein
MAMTIKTDDSKLAYTCRKAQRAGDPVALTINERGRAKEIAGRIRQISLEPTSAGALIWQITLA